MVLGRALRMLVVSARSAVASIRDRLPRAGSAVQPPPGGENAAVFSVTKEELDTWLTQTKVAVWRLELPIPLDWQYAIWVEQDEEEGN